MAKSEQLLQGKYHYLSEGKIYTEEIFHVDIEESLQRNISFHSEVLTRVKTGEFLKVYVKYIVTPSFDPVLVTITRQLGAKESCESFHIDQKSKKVSYTFETGEEKHSYEKVYSTTPHIATPCFLTSMIMVQQRRMDSVHRTPYTILRTNNIWAFDGNIEEQQVYVEMQEIGLVKIELDGVELKATHCKILNADEKGTISNEGYSVYLSKYYSIPYRAFFDNNIEIGISSLKNLEGEFQKYFK